MEGHIRQRPASEEHVPEAEVVAYPAAISAYAFLLMFGCFSVEVDVRISIIVG